MSPLTDPSADEKSGSSQMAGRRASSCLRHATVLSHLVLLFCSISFASGQQNPTISFISKEKVVEIGDTLELLCTVQFATDYPVIWIKQNQENPNNFLFISRGSSVNIPNSRFSVKVDSKKFDLSSSTYRLIIDRIQETDTGRYS